MKTGFKEFYEAYQDELDQIGKRPDILIFRTEDYNPTWNFNVSHLAENEQTIIVPKAVAGLEIRSSSFLVEKIAGKVAMPNHQSDCRELDRGRLLFFIKFEGGEAYLNTENLFHLLKLSIGD